MRRGTEIAWHAGRERAVEIASPRGGVEAAAALFRAGRAEQALVALAEDSSFDADRLRAECRAQLGELGAAREAIRRLEALELDGAGLLAAGDIALRVLVNSGEPEAARDWGARAVARSRGAAKVAARQLAALAAIDRGELDRAAEILDETCDAATDEAGDGLRAEARLQLALARSDGSGAAALAAERLRRGRRRMGRVAAGRAWSNLGFARSLGRDFSGAERAYAHAARLLRRCDGPLAITLAGSNLADVRLRLGKLRDVEAILEASSAWNRRSGNVRGRSEDELLWARRDLVTGDFARAAKRCRAAREEGWAQDRLAALEARALGWLELPSEAREALAVAGESGLGELEPEEIPFLFALAGESDAALGAAGRPGVPPLAAALVRGESPRPDRWRELDALEPFRRARFVFDAELLLPGAAPRDRRADAAALFRRLGAARPAAVCERGEAVAWQALGRYFDRPPGDRGAIEELLAEIGHPEAELLLRTAQGELRLAGGGGRELAAERAAPLGEGELVLRATEIDEPLRALFALFRRELPPPTADATEGDSSLAGESPALRAALDRLRRFAASELPVLILGENGTGKELAAAEIHRTSARAKGPWVPVNCAGLSETLLLSELFGHVRGAFTGADQPRAGVFEAARGGTVFLDEIGDLPLVAQGSLLRVLQEREIRRLGESLPRKVDVRVVAATNRDLEAMVDQGTFRQDLYFRLKVATLTLPPLRERGNDVLLLAERFLSPLRERRPELRLTPDGRRALTAHPWPGNVRELKNALEAAAALSEDGLVTPEHLDLRAAPAPGGEGDYHRRLEAYRRRLIEGALAAAEGSLAGAARQLGVTRQFLSQYVRKYGLDVRR